jgi:hypothetical protein
MKNPPGLVKIETGGSARTTHVEIDGVTPQVKRATIIIDPANGENQIKLHCYSRQANGRYEDGEVQTFYGISKENFEFFKDLMKHISEVDDVSLDHELRPNYIEAVSVYALLYFIREARKEKTDEQA